MDLALNIVLLCIAFAAALSSIGGETWRKDPELPVRRRITARGWVAIGSWLLALILGVAKEYRTTAAAGRSARQAESVQADLRERLAAANARLEAAKTDILQQQERTIKIVSYITLAMLDLQTPTVYRRYASFRLGLMWYWLQSFPESIYHFQAEVKRDPHHVPSRYNLGVVLAAAGRPGDAKAEFEQILIRPGRRGETVQRWLTSLRAGRTPPEKHDWDLWQLP
jgi:hypothetical protein